MSKHFLPVVLLLSAAVQADNVVGVIPLPKQVKDNGGVMVLAPAGKVVIVLSSQAHEPERYAATRLLELLARRYHVTLPVVDEQSVPTGVTQQILLGQQNTNERLKQWCEQKQIRWDHEPPPDSYAIEVFDKDGVILVCGSNDRGVIYGAQTLFKLLRPEGDRILVPVVSIRDWPSIPWRGRPHSGIETHMTPGVMDAYLWAGLNFIDVRAGAFGYGPDAKLDRNAIGRCLKEAHRRGLFVYGTVSCGIRPQKFDGALRVFQELIDLGVDGLWISFDDPGGGTGATDLVRRVLQLGREKGFTGRTIATTPPTGSYQKIDTAFNRKMAQVPGMKNATWFFTRNPCHEDLLAARNLGLKSQPAWWHNWPRTDAGFTHGSYGGRSFRRDGRPSYMEVPPLTWGWHRPDYEKLRDASDNTNTVMMWGGWQPEYTGAVLGIWAWDPKRHDFERTRRAIYRTVYGPACVEDMRRFDDDLHTLKTNFLLPDRTADPKHNFPPRLLPHADRNKVAARIAEMEKLAQKVARKAPAETLLTADRLQTCFLKPMQAELATAKVLASLQRPEDWWPAHEAAVLAKLAAGNRASVEALCAQARPKVKQQIAAITAALPELQGMDAYARLWDQRAAGGADYWKKVEQARARAFDKHLASLKKTGLDVDAMLAALAAPPAGGQLLETVDLRQLATSTISSRGKWSTGLYPREKPEAFVMSFPLHTASAPGDFCQVAFTLQVPAFQGKLLAQIFLNDEYDSTRWIKYRFYQLRHGNQVLWEEDIARTRAGGHEWTSVDLTPLATGKKTLDLSLRVLDRRPVGNYQTTIFVGPIRLVQEP